MNENWFVDSKSELARFFDVSVNTVSNWLLRGCPHTTSEGRKRYRFYLPDVVAWMSLGVPSDDEEPEELSVARAKLAMRQTEKTAVETKIKEAQLGTILQGGVIPASAARQLFLQGEIIMLHTVAGMVVTVPELFLQSDYMKEVETKRGPMHRLRSLMDPYRLQARDEFRQASENLLARFLGDDVGSDDVEKEAAK